MTFMSLASELHVSDYGDTAITRIRVLFVPRRIELAVAWWCNG